VGFILILMTLGGIRYLFQLGDTPPFEMVAVEGERRLHVRCEGPDNAPFVLFDAGMFGNHTHGAWVLEALKADHRVCLYDRAGMGWSDPVPAGTAPTPDWHVEDMQRLRAALGQDAPFVLIGHSMAGFRLHAYANTYPDDLRGLVFVDAVRPIALSTERFESFRSWLEGGLSFTAFLSRIGVTGGAMYFISGDFDHSGDMKKDNRRAYSSVRHHKATKAEITAALDAFPNAHWRTEETADQIPVFVYTNIETKRSNAPVARAALDNTGLGGVTILPEASHVSLLNEANAKLIAQDVRTITGQVSGN
jgi:pimeloyl-ACP methyl ester carboxylesterase